MIHLDLFFWFLKGTIMVWQPILGKICKMTIIRQTGVLKHIGTSPFWFQQVYLQSFIYIHRVKIWWDLVQWPPSPLCHHCQSLLEERDLALDQSAVVSASCSGGAGSGTGTPVTLGHLHGHFRPRLCGLLGNCCWRAQTLFPVEEWWVPIGLS